MEKTGMPAFADVSDGRVQAVKILEEASKLCESGKAYATVREHDELKVIDRTCRDSVLDEFAEMLQAIVNFAACFRITEEELDEALKRCVKRNRERGRYC